MPLTTSPSVRGKLSSVTAKIAATCTHVMRKMHTSDIQSSNCIQQEQQNVRDSELRTLSFAVRLKRTFAGTAPRFIQNGESDKGLRTETVADSYSVPFVYHCFQQSTAKVVDSLALFQIWRCRRSRLTTRACHLRLQQPTTLPSWTERKWVPLFLACVASGHCRATRLGSWAKAPSSAIKLYMTDEHPICPICTTEN